MSEAQSVLYFLSVITLTLADYCPASGNTFFCEYGCCGNSCCPNHVAIGVGTTFGGVVLLIVGGGVFICCIQRRYSPKEEVKITKDDSTQWEKNPQGINMTARVESRARRRRSTVLPQPPPAFALKQQQERVAEEEEKSEAAATENAEENAENNVPDDNPA
uniref:Uncharacterized protein LOC111124503 n=1 Tax=Crassostrea virginica TaxID=6565 RepID=A0A8B8D8C3_CRAVI|nr:uncharacterized protein LOC111124503 [Crassostrea virginica]